MKQVRIRIGHELIQALHECNCADVQPGYGSVQPNDINPKCSRQHEAYGHISKALTSLGFNKAREVYVNKGDIDAAHEAIDNKPRSKQKKLAHLLVAQAQRIEEEAEANNMAGNQMHHEFGGAA